MGDRLSRPADCLEVTAYQGCFIKDARAVVGLQHQHDAPWEESAIRDDRRESLLACVQSLNLAVEARDPYTRGHSERVARLALDLALLIGLPEQACGEIYLSGILHDVGKIGIPDRVLLKHGRLTDEEYGVIRRHPEIGYRIVQRLGHLQFALPGVLYHHERWDGAGYPHGLSGETIPLMARIMAVADAFDAMTSSRPYRTAMPLEKARAIVAQGSGSQWDPQVVDCCVAWISRCGALPRVENALIPAGAQPETMLRAVRALSQPGAFARLDAPQDIPQQGRGDSHLTMLMGLSPLIGCDDLSDDNPYTHEECTQHRVKPFE